MSRRSSSAVLSDDADIVVAYEEEHSSAFVRPADPDVVELAVDTGPECLDVLRRRPAALEAGGRPPDALRCGWHRCRRSRCRAGRYVVALSKKVRATYAAAGSDRIS